MLLVEKLPDPGELVAENEFEKAIAYDQEMALRKSSGPKYQKLSPARSLDEGIVKDGRLAISLDTD